MSVDVHTMVGAYALDAVSPEESDQFETHLHTCPACREDLGGLQATAARLAVAVAEPASPTLRERVLEAVSRSPQERPRVTALLPGPWRRWAPGLLAAAAVLAIVGSLGAYVVEHGRSEDAQRQQAAVSQRLADAQHQEAVMADMLAAPDAGVHPVTLDNGARVSVVSSSSLDQAVLASTQLPAAGEGKDYEVWTIGENGPVSQGVMEPGDGGTTSLKLVDDLDGATVLAITVEPAGGSPSGEPTSEPIVAVELA